MRVRLLGIGSPIQVLAARTREGKGKQASTAPEAFAVRALSATGIGSRAGSAYRARL